MKLKSRYRVVALLLPLLSGCSNSSKPEKQPELPAKVNVQAVEPSPAPLSETMWDNEINAALRLAHFCSSQETFWLGAHRNGVQSYAQSLPEMYGYGKIILKEEAEAEGPNGTPCHGYLFKILTKQGVNARDGKHDYKDTKGNMREEYGLLAWPAQYGVTGKRCFMLSKEGNLVEANLGAETSAAMEKMDAYDPDPKVWKKVGSASK